MFASCSSSDGEAGATDEENPNGIGEPLRRTDSYLGIFPEFTAFTVSGTGSEDVDLPGEAWAGVVSATSDSGKFRLEAVDSSGETATLVDALAAYDGSTAYGLDGEEDVSGLVVTADGSWTLTVSSVRDLPDLPASGTGDGVYRSPEDTRTVEFSFLRQGWTTVTTYPDYATPERKIEYLGPGIPTSGLGAMERRKFELNSLDTLVTIVTPGAWTITDT